MISIKPLEVIWFENISAFNEPVLGLGPIRASMKQLLYTMLALALALSIMNIAKNLILAIPIAGFMLLLAYAKPYGQNMEVLLIDMVSFFFGGRKKSTGVVLKEKKGKEEKVSSNDKDKKTKEDEKEEVKIEKEVEVPVPITTLQATPMKGEVAEEEKEEEGRSEYFIPLTTPNTTVPINNTANLLHYIVPASKDFNLEILEKEHVIATGESIIHISTEEYNNTIIVIEVRGRTIARITVNRQ
ncbi:MAG: hypothetical protein QW416_08740 [Candidatus Nitrosocaldaceae archaeon]